MQTFIVETVVVGDNYPSHIFQMTAAKLDNKRLGKQRVECLQILNSLKHKTAWYNHPAVQMWKGFERALALYGLAMCSEWVYERNFVDNCSEKISKFIVNENGEMDINIIYPNWLYNKQLAESHRSNLIRKKPEHYKKFWPEVPNNIPYYWPTKNGYSVCHL